MGDVRGAGVENAAIPIERITNAILLIRWQKVMLDTDLAGLYAVATKALNRAVTRNADRFPPDFMFQLTNEEVVRLRYQFGTSKRGGRSPAQTRADTFFETPAHPSDCGKLIDR